MWRSIRGCAFCHGFTSTASPSLQYYRSRQALSCASWRPVPNRLSERLKPLISPNESQKKRSFYAGSVDHTGSGQPTIYALSTASGRAAIAVIRISGSACRQIYSSLCPGRPFPRPRYATLRTLYDPSEAPSPGTILDSDALVLFFPSPQTVTGEDVLELHIHGGTATIRAVLAAIPRYVPSPSTSSTRLPIRYAEPGEFTRRAFLHDRLSLPQVEALGDTLAATTEQQRRLSVRGAASENSLAQTYESWRQLLLHARGELEALIDFSEDQQFEEAPAQLAAGVASQVERLKARMQAHIQNATKGELLRNGISLALLGQPNAGKSSLLNCIVGREAAIVSREAGTTRDVVEVGIDLGGWFVRLGDTAGLRKRDDETLAASNLTGSGEENDTSHVVGTIEGEGIRRAKERASESDVVVVVLSLEAGADVSGCPSLQLDAEVIDTARRCRNVVIAINKIDLQSDQASSPGLWVPAIQRLLPEVQASRIFEISCRDASTTLPKSQGHDPGGIQALLHGLIGLFADLTTAHVPEHEGAAADPSIWQESLGATERQRRLLDECVACLDGFLDHVRTGGPTTTNDVGDLEWDLGEDLDVVVAAEDLRAAAECLARIIGKGESGDVEEVLGVIFEK